MDEIFVRGIPCQARIGASQQENLQKLLVDVVLSIDLEAAANTDDLKLTVNYHWIIQKVQETADQNRFHLLESLNRKLCRTLLQNARIESVQVAIHRFPESLKGKSAEVVVKLTRGH